MPFERFGILQQEILEDSFSYECAPGYASVIMSIKITLTPSKICLCYFGTACRYINYVFFFKTL